METRNRLGGESAVYEISPEYSADIDTMDDLHRCELALQKRELSCDTGSKIPTPHHGPRSMHTLELDGLADSAVDE